MRKARFALLLGWLWFIPGVSPAAQDQPDTTATVEVPRAATTETGKVKHKSDPGGIKVYTTEGDKRQDCSMITSALQDSGVPNVNPEDCYQGRVPRPSRSAGKGKATATPVERPARPKREAAKPNSANQARDRALAAAKAEQEAARKRQQQLEDELKQKTAEADQARERLRNLRARAPRERAPELAYNTPPINTAPMNQGAPVAQSDSGASFFNRLDLGPTIRAGLGGDFVLGAFGDWSMSDRFDIEAVIGGAYITNQRLSDIGVSSLSRLYMEVALMYPIWNKLRIGPDYWSIGRLGPFRTTARTLGLQAEYPVWKLLLGVNAGWNFAPVNGILGSGLTAGVSISLPFTVFGSNRSMMNPPTTPSMPKS